MSGEKTETSTHMQANIVNKRSILVSSQFIAELIGNMVPQTTAAFESTTRPFILEC